MMFHCKLVSLLCNIECICLFLCFGGQQYEFYGARMSDYGHLLISLSLSLSLLKNFI